MALFGLGKKKQTKTVPPTQPKRIPMVPPVHEVVTSITLTQSKAFRGYRRLKISSRNSDIIENNEKYFKQCDWDFSNRTVQLMVEKIPDVNDVRVLIIVDGRFLGNLYRNDRNAEAIDKIVSGEVDGVFIKYDEKIIDGESYGSEAFVFLHWPDMGVKVSVK